MKSELALSASWWENVPILYSNWAEIISRWCYEVIIRNQLKIIISVFWIWLCIELRSQWLKIPSKSTMWTPNEFLVTEVSQQNMCLWHQISANLLEISMLHKALHLNGTFCVCCSLQVGTKGSTSSLKSFYFGPKDGRVLHGECGHDGWGRLHHRDVMDAAGG